MGRYIGARYVTKVYENSLDPSSAEWEAGVTYEPLTMVTYLNGSYLSKKEVPGSVGDPAANPNYWSQTGFYNGQIAALNNRVSALETEALEIPKKDYIALGDVSLTRYDYGRYCVDVTKINYLKNDGVTKNIPIIRGTNTADNMVNFADNAKIATNIGYYGSGQSYGSMLAEGNIYLGDVLTDPNESYMAISDNGDLVEYPYTTPIADIKADGYNNAAAVRCQIIKDGLETSPNPIAARFMQQLFGVDYDHNYYIITTSHYCTLTGSQQVALIQSLIPNIKDVFALDSGGSAQTIVAGRRINLEGDIQANGLGRPVAGALVIPVDNNDSDINKLSNIFLHNNNIVPKMLFDVGSVDTPIGTNIECFTSSIYQIGNLVIGQMNFTAKAGYDGSWTRLNYFDNILPKTYKQFTAVGSQVAVASPNSCGLRMQVDSSQLTTDSNLEFRAPAATSDTYYSMTFTYITNQNL